MTTIDNLLPFHEAAHYVAYILACKRNNIQPRIYGISAPQKGKGYFSRGHIINENILEGVLKSELPQRVKDGMIKLAKDEIRIILAGNAAEYILFNLNDPKKHLQVVIKMDKKPPKSDINRAKEYCRIIGIEAILPFYKEAIKEIRENWKDVIDIANSIDKLEKK